MRERGESTRGEALEIALRALEHRDVSALDLERRLARRGISEPDRDDVLETLVRSGLVDDRRFAETRAASLAARGAGDLLIHDRLSRAGVASELADDIIDALDPELERARGIVTRRGPGAKTARYLMGKGFTEETVAAVANGKADG